jgi:hypothetical protein
LNFVRLIIIVTTITITIINTIRLITTIITAAVVLCKLGVCALNLCACGVERGKQHLFGGARQSGRRAEFVATKEDSMERVVLRHAWRREKEIIQKR